MDLRNSLQEQQDVNMEDSDEFSPDSFYNEDHPLPELSKHRKRNISGAVVHIFTAFILFLTMIGALLTMSIFVVVQHAVDTGSSAGCILFASYDTENTPAFQFGAPSICDYIMWSLVAVSIICFLYICRSCCNVLCNLALGLST